MEKYKIDEIEERVKASLSPKRFAHTRRVIETALEIGRCHNVDAEKLRVAALLHDCAKNYDEDKLLELCEMNKVKLSQFQMDNRELIHGILGAAMAKNVYNIEDEDILNAIKNHTTGRAEMSPLEMVIYVSDFCEPGRRVPEAKPVYIMAKKNLEKSVYLALNSSLKYLLGTNKQIDNRSIECRNWLLNKI